MFKTIFSKSFRGQDASDGKINKNETKFSRAKVRASLESKIFQLDAEERDNF